MIHYRVQEFVDYFRIQRQEKEVIKKYWGLVKKEKVKWVTISKDGVPMSISNCWHTDAFRFDTFDEAKKAIMDIVFYPKNHYVITELTKK